jgi:hypothetical protein
MLRMIFVGFGALAVLVFGLQPTRADEAPWCAVVSEGYWDCQYHTIEECRPNVLAGNRGWCNQNPYFVAPYRPTEHRQYRSRYVRPQ